MSSSEEELDDIYHGMCDQTRLGESLQMQAVLNNDVNDLFRLLQNGESANICDNHTLQPEMNTTSIFNSINEVADIPLNAPTYWYREIPLSLAVALNHMYFVRKLLEKGADPNLRYPNGDSLLHHTTDIGIVRLLLEHGADINAQGCDGQTPLFHACQRGKMELVHMFLYYGADVTITDNCGFLLYDICRENVDSLFYLTFDEHTEVSLLTLFKAIQNESPHLKEIVKLTRNVIYSIKQVKELAAQIFPYPDFNWVDLNDFIDPLIKNEFGYSMQIFRLMNVETHTCDMITIEDFCFILLYYYVLDNLQFPLVLRRLDSDRPHQFAIKFACYCASRGYEITSQDLDDVYRFFGFSELYRMLLNIAKIRNNCCKFDSYAGYNFMAFLTYDLNLGINMIEHFQEVISVDGKLLNFFNLVKFKNKFPLMFKMFGHKLASAVPSLVELSRNTARNFIISKFKVEDNVQFLTVVNHLPIPNVIKQIIIYQKEIYNL